jgi:hypothetical protein
MKKIYLLAAILATVILLILFVLYNRYASYYEEEKISQYISKHIDILNENLDFEKKYALSLSLFVSKNETIKKALIEKNQQMALAEMKRFLDEIKHSTGIDNIDIQIHTSELKAFARNWDKSAYYGTSLSAFRQGLVRVKKTLEPFVSIELGKRLNIKAISPILDKDHRFIGSIEIIMGFHNIKQRLQKFDLQILGLLDQKFINIAVDLKENKRVKNYYTVERQYPIALYHILQDHPSILTSRQFYHRIGNRIIVLIPMKSVGIEDVGVIALSMPATYNDEIAAVKVDYTKENNAYRFNQQKREVIIK